MLAHVEVTATAAVIDGAVVGSCFVTDTGPIAAIGPISVAPTVQDGSVGRQMGRSAMSWSHGRRRRWTGMNEAAQQPIGLFLRGWRWKK
jgi:hypothetical protein